MALGSVRKLVVKRKALVSVLVAMWAKCTLTTKEYLDDTCNVMTIRVPTVSSKLVDERYFGVGVENTDDEDCCDWRVPLVFKGCLLTLCLFTVEKRTADLSRG